MKFKTEPLYKHEVLFHLIQQHEHANFGHNITKASVNSESGNINTIQERCVL